MSIKRILVPLPGFVEHLSEIDMAMSAAKALAAHVEVMFVRVPPPVTRTSVGASEMAYGRATVMATQINRYVEEQEKRAQGARERFMHACSANGIRVLGANEEPGSLPAASWRETEGTYRVLRDRSGGRLRPDGRRQLRRRRVAPRGCGGIAPADAPPRAACAVATANQPHRRSDDRLDESPECWHAVSGAIPFLTIANSVQVISVARKPESRTASQAEVLAYLRCHGIIATARVVEPHLRSVGDTLLAEAQDNHVGLLVMGAYSHSRLRELLLGGATQQILKSAASTPVFMAH